MLKGHLYTQKNKAKSCKNSAGALLSFQPAWYGHSELSYDPATYQL